MVNDHWIYGNSLIYWAQESRIKNQEPRQVVLIINALQIHWSDYSIRYK
jgi:hypothetical protein